MKTLENVNEKTGLSRDYLIALAPAKNFVKRMTEKSDGEVGARWVHLAFRTMQQRGIIPYIEYFESLGYDVPELTGEQTQYGARIDKLVYDINLPFNGTSNEHEVCNVEGEQFKLIESSTRRAVNLISIGREAI